MWRIYFFEYAHFWFLQAIILIFAFTLLAERWLHSLRGLLLTLAVLFAAQLTVQGTKFFSIDGALYLAPFFVLGIGANRFRAAFSGERVRMVCLAILVAAWSYYAMLCFTEPLAAPGKRTALGSLLSVVSCLAVIHWTPRVPWLAWVGTFSFTVYLYHVFFTAAARIGLNVLGDPGNAVHVVVGVAAGLLGPILVELTVQRWPPLARRALLGQS
jgi:peptidoglycan/LPS O-acetylase OafA/YrhL